MKYVSTRGGVPSVTFEEVVFSAYAGDGGLFVPETIPIIDFPTLCSFALMTYDQVAAKVLSYYVSDDIRPHLPKICKKAFSHFDSQLNINNQLSAAPLRQLGPVYVLEAFHGPTLAFKDIGLNILAQFMELILSRRNQHLPPSEKEYANVLVETSGDTGPAAVSSVVLNTTFVNVFCMFPRKQVTHIQARQLTTMMPKHNTPSRQRLIIYTNDKNSDDQCLVIKKICNDTLFVNKYNICAMNSINIIRILSQITYYFWAYAQLFKDKLININNSDINNINKLPIMDIAIPSGAFGNTTACCFSKEMGLPIRYIIPSTNDNDIVSRMLNNGDYSSYEYNYHHTLAPAMDVQVAYNTERFFWLTFGKNSILINKIMKEFELNAENMIFKYQFDAVYQNMFKKFVNIAYKTNDKQVMETTKNIWDKYGYVTCPHSVCSIYAGLDFVNKLMERNGNGNGNGNDKDGNNVPMVCIGTAHPSKFPKIIEKSMNSGNGSVRGDEYKKWFKHRFLPKENDKDEFILLPSDGNWSKKWIDIVKNDIQRLNPNKSGRGKSKL